MEVKKRQIIVEEEVYVAFDGTEFKTELQCDRYESELRRQENMLSIAKLEVKGIGDLLPLDTHGLSVNDSHYYTWYKVNDEGEWNTIIAVYGGYLKQPESFPEIVCLENCGYTDEYLWVYRLSEMKQDTIDFWRNFGFDIEFKER